MNFIKNGGITTPKGFNASGIYCGIRKKNDKFDLALIYANRMCNSAAVYTKNLVKGAPIYVTRENLENGMAQAIICNSGNANTCNADGIDKAKLICEKTAEVLGIGKNDVIIASTGVIGQPIDAEKIVAALPELTKKLGKNQQSSDDAARAIMTTDLVKKEFAIEVEIGGKTACIAAIAKGSGMINPNMATMLCFITTDLAISVEMLHSALVESIGGTFNMTTVDGDTSTNDMVSVMASGLAGNAEITAKNEDYNLFLTALNMLNKAVCMAIAKDGEGATKLIVSQVFNAKSDETAKKIAKTVVSSPLVKTMIFGADANFGRILCAIGYNGVEVDVNKIDIEFMSAAGSVVVSKNGMSFTFDEETAKKILLENEIYIKINLNDGHNQAEAYGCDLTYEYVRINGDYRS